MSKANGLETGMLELIFQNDDTNTTIAAIGDGLQASATAGNLYVSLHTADPGEGGSQTTSEADYTGYARVAVARSGAGWTVAGNEATNAAEIEFGACTAGSNTITYAAVGTAATPGAGYILYSGALSSSLAVSVGITPKIAAGELDITED